MSAARLLGLVLLAIGVVLLVFGMNAADSPLDQISETVTGRFTEDTMLYFILGAALAAGGVALLLFGRRT